MAQHTSPHTLRLCGEVVEAFEKDGRSIARVVLKSGCIEISMDSLTEHHLGDHVVIDLEINVHRVRHEHEVTGPDMKNDF